MSNNNYTAKEFSFWKFIQENEIEIPIIQRDYAHGREGKESLRKNFLADLKKALDNEKPYNNKVMKLDFVYGSIEHQKMNPLDGQQRLTTLWLLHWFIALRAGKLGEVAKTLNRFSYETRISSREFCNNLCYSEHFTGFNGKDIVGFIAKQTWFYSAWKQDPTIQSMLRMLGGTKITNKKGEDIIDGIEELFDETKDFEGYWTKLTSDNPPIVFYHLPLKDFGLSDDLYIKMNARGKQLTSFENFKADLVSYITEQSESELLDEEMQNKWRTLLNETDGIPIKMDTTWTDIFWRNMSEDSKIDEIYFAFLNRFFWDKLFMYKKDDGKYVLDIGKGDESSTQENENLSYKYLNNSEAGQNVYDTTIAYKELDVYKFFNSEIPYTVFEDLQKILDRNTEIPICEWDDSFNFIPEYEKDNNGDCVDITDNNGEKIRKVTYLNQVHRVVFHAVCKYLIDGNADKNSLKQWMRVVWNLVSGEDSQRPQIRSTSAMRSAMEFIDRLDSHDVYNSLDKFNDSLSDSAFDRRCKEEIAKAKQILYGKPRSDGESWEDVIIEAEKTAFFKGAIRFLFQDANGHPNWDDFDIKWMNAKKYFDADGVKDDENSGVHYKTDAILLKAVLFHVKDFWSYIECHKFVFDNKGNTWKSNILLEQGWELAVHKIMMNDHHVIERNDDCLMYKDLYNSNLLNYVAMHQINSRINWIHGHRALYPPRYEGILLDDDKNGFYRNRILFGLLTDNLIKTNHKIECCDFFKGWDVNFYYIKDEKQFEFQWNTDNHVYLIENGKWVVKDNTTDEKYEKYLCFDVSTIKEKDVFLSELNNLISK